MRDIPTRAKDAAPAARNAAASLWSGPVGAVAGAVAVSLYSAHFDGLIARLRYPFV